MSKKGHGGWREVRPGQGQRGGSHGISVGGLRECLISGLEQKGWVWGGTGSKNQQDFVASWPQGTGVPKTLLCWFLVLEEWVMIMEASEADELSLGHSRKVCSRLLNSGPQFS